jgi:effector-binding domain-containing protein
MLGNPKIEHRQELRYAAIRTALPIPFGSKIPPLWGEVWKWLEAKGFTSSQAALIRYLTTDMSQKLDMDIGYVVDRDISGDERIRVDRLPAGDYATLLYTGPYRGKGVYKANVAMIEWANENNVHWSISRKDGVEWWNGRVEFYLTDSDKEKDTKKYQTELAFLVE